MFPFTYVKPVHLTLVTLWLLFVLQRGCNGREPHRNVAKSHEALSDTRKANEKSTQIFSSGKQGYSKRRSLEVKVARGFGRADNAPTIVLRRGLGKRLRVSKRDASSVITGIHLDYNDSLTLSCKKSSSYLLQWRRVHPGSTQIKASCYASTCRVKILGSEGGGVYVCVSRKRYSWSSYQSMNITIYVAPRIVTAPADVAMDCASSVYLHCSAIGFPAPTIAWESANGSQVLLDNASYTRRAYRSDFEVRSREDSGNYSCKVINSLGNDRKDVTVSAIACLESTLPSVVISYYQTTWISCSATGNPVPRLEWYSPSRSRLYGETSTGKIRTVSRLKVYGKNGGGSYRCRLFWRNQYTYKYRYVIVYVLAKVSSLEIRDASSNRLLSDGSYVHIGTYIVAQCSAVGFGRPSVTWTSGVSQQSYSSKSRGRTEISVLRGVVRSGIEITCRASNSKGTDSRTGRVHVFPQVIGLSVGSVLYVKDGTVGPSVHCRSVGSPNLRVEWVKRRNSGQILKVNESDYLDLGLVSRVENGTEYRCVVRAGPYSDSSSFTLSVRPDVTISGLTRWIGREWQRANLTCVAFGASVETVHWYNGSQRIYSHGNVVVSITTDLTRNLSSSLLIQNANLYQGGGHFYCTAGTRENPSLRQSPVVIIGIIRGLSFPDVTTYKGYRETTVKCTVGAKPRPHVTITNQQQSVSNVYLESQAGQMWTFRGTIRRVQLADSVNFVCISWFDAPSSAKAVNQSAILKMMPYITSRMNNLSHRREGQQSVRLECSGEGNPRPQFTWTRTLGYSVENISNKATSVYHGDFHVSSAIYLKPGWTTSTAAGSYVCTLSNFLTTSLTRPYGQSTQSQAVVQVGPGIQLNGSRSVAPSLGGDIYLRCIATGFPVPSIRWRFRGKYLTGKIRRNNVTYAELLLGRTGVLPETDGGNYTCMAWNSIATVFQVFDVRFAPRVMSLTPASTIVESSEDVTLTCEIEGYPLPESGELRWYKNGILSTRGPVTNAIFSYGTRVMSSLRMKAVMLSDSGHYQCYTTTSKEVAAVVAGASVQISPSRLNGIVGGNVLFRCSASWQPPLSIVWGFLPNGDHGTSGQRIPFVMNSTVSESVIQSFLTLDVISRSSAGFYWCSVDFRLNNQVLQSNSTRASLNVQYPPAIVASPTSQRIRRGQKYQLECQWDANPGGAARWYNKRNPTLVIPSTASCRPFGHRGSADCVGRLSLTATLARLPADMDGYFCRVTNHLGSTQSLIANVTVLDTPLPPSVMILNVSSTTALISWKSQFNGNSPIVDYNVRFRRNSDYRYWYPGTISANQPLILTLTGLEPYNSYTVFVRANNAVGFRGYSSGTALQTLPDVPSQVNGFWANSVSSTALQITWRRPVRPHGPISLYRVYYKASAQKKRSTRKEFSADFPGHLNLAVISGLNKFTIYEVTMTAINIVNGKELESKQRMSKSFSTSEDAPSAPVNVTVTNVTETQFVVLWQKPAEANGIIRKYEVDVFHLTTSARAQSLLTVDRNVLSLLIQNLTAYTNYTILVRGVTVWPGNSSVPLILRTSEGVPSSPTNASVVSVTAKQVKIQWSEPATRRGVIRKYRIYYWGQKLYSEGYVTNLFLLNRQVDVSNSSYPRQYTIGDLQADLNYSINVTAFTSKGESPSSALLSAKTFESSPVIPRAPILTYEPRAQQTASNVTVGLIQPSNLNGNISYVQLIVIVGDDVTSRKTSYVAAKFVYSAIPDTFVIGDDGFYGSHWNAPLNPGKTYSVFLQSVGVSYDGKALNSSGPLLLLPKNQNAEQSSRSNQFVLYTSGSAVGVFVILLVLLAILIFVRRRKRRACEQSLTPNVYHVDPETPEYVSLDDLSRKDQKSANGIVVCSEGDKCILSAEGKPDSYENATWWYNGRKLTEGKRITFSDDNSLQIECACRRDAGTYVLKAAEENCEILLKIQTRSGAVLDKAAINASDFEDYVEGLSKEDCRPFAEEFKLLRGIKLSGQQTVSRRQVNQGKNVSSRVSSCILPYDHCRVILERVANKPGSDYINASYVKGLHSLSEYIAAQGPARDTVDDFWRMIWEKKVAVIVMIAEVGECVKYWPSLGSGLEFGHLQVTLDSIQKSDDFTVRQLSVTDGQRTSFVTHYHFNQWPNAGQSLKTWPFLEFVIQARKGCEQGHRKASMLVHCTNGSGRTGSFITIDMALQHLIKSDTVDLFGLILSMRQFRPQMVETIGQYVYCHNVVLDHLLRRGSRVSAENVRSLVRSLNVVDSTSNSIGYDRHLKLLEKMNGSMQNVSYSLGANPANAAKNRYSQFLPPDKTGVLLKSPLDSTDCSSYINAYYVEGPGNDKQSTFIAAQCPLSCTMSDFWTMVWEQNSRIIVMLAQLRESGKKNSEKFWPRKGRPLSFGNLVVVFKNEENNKKFVKREFQLINASNKEESVRLVAHFHIVDWPPADVPKLPTSVVAVVQETARLQREGEDAGRILVTCSDGVQRSSTFCAVYCLIQTLKADAFVDVVKVIHILRDSHPAAVTTVDHYRFCYVAMSEYLSDEKDC
eukprot:m.191630 g.191630  ORF g.191630 m.191630 type:complete len:2530 (+) comp39450_c0_seq43:90-7679(+)